MESKTIMPIKSKFIEAPIEFKPVIEPSEGAILNKHLIEFYYESKPTNKNKNGNKSYRIIRPYMIIPRGEILELVGIPITELTEPREKREAGHYTIAQLSQRLKSKQFRISSETFDDPGALRDRIVNTKTPPVCRFIYEDEDLKKVKAEWLKIKYVK